MAVEVRRWLLLALALGGCDPQATDDPVAPACVEGEGPAIFEDRIAPLLRDDRASTCNACHLAGVNLGLYAKSGDECATMACMVESGIVDLSDPEDSVVLDWILRGSPDSALITADVIQEEHDGMLEWIRYQADCGQSVCEPVDDPCGGTPMAETCETPPSGHDLPPRGFDESTPCTDVAIEAAFADLVYSWRGRCYPCHYASQPGPPQDAPRWIYEGDCDAAAAQSMRRVLDLGLVDFDDPTQSLLLRKPLTQSLGGLEHGGDDKFLTADDGAYADYTAWVDFITTCGAP